MSNTEGRRWVCVAEQVGAQVMLLRNLDLTTVNGRMLVNGSRGVVEALKPVSEVSAVTPR